jgi:hypothetical protein
MAAGDEIVGFIDKVDKYGGPALGNAARNVQGIVRGGQALLDKISGSKIPVPSINVTSASGKTLGTDMRVRIKVPDFYRKYLQPGVAWDRSLYNLGGIIFPYTPQISYDNKADYASVTPTHSNYTQYFYKNSSVSDIMIVGKFTVQNEADAYRLLSTIHLLKALTKMRFGTDPDAGAPPPVCRLFAYGQKMLDNTPIAIKSFRIELPEGVDYFTVDKSSDSFKPEPASVPTSCTITLSCYVIYSRNEIKNFSVKNWLTNGRTGGYL